MRINAELNITYTLTLSHAELTLLRNMLQNIPDSTDVTMREFNGQLFEAVSKRLQRATELSAP